MRGASPRCRVVRDAGKPAGPVGILPDTVDTTLGLRTPTTLAYAGPRAVANGEPAALAAILRDYAGTPVTGRPVELALGSGGDRQACTGTTDSTGTARCTIASVRQPLTDAATVPFAGSFAGDPAYLPSGVAATVLLRYYTGQAYGIAAALRLPLLPVTVPSQPDTGAVRTADARTVAPPCTATISALVLTARGLCASFATTLNPGGATATATAQETSIGLPGLPLIGLSGVRAEAVARCAGASATTLVSVTIGGAPVSVSDAPDTAVALPDGSRLVINEQRPVPGADQGITVTAAHLIVAGGLGEVTLGNATAAVHHCG